MNMPETGPAGIASQLKLDAHWMPYTANRNFQRDPRLIVAAEGNYLVDDHGRKIDLRRPVRPVDLRRRAHSQGNR